MNPATWVEVGLIVVHFGGLVTLILLDPAGLADAKYGD